MARVQVPLEIQSPSNGSAISGATITVTQHVVGGTLGAGPAAVIYLGETGTSNVGTNQVTTDTLGRVTQGSGAGYAAYWLLAGTYDFTVSGTGLTSYTITRELVSAQGSDMLALAGEIKFGHWLTLPAGFLWCSGPNYTQNVSRTTYAALFAAITLSTTGTLNGTVTVSAVPSGVFSTLAQIGPSSGCSIPISGSNIPTGTTITGYSSGGQTLTLSQPATGSGSGVALVIAPNGVGDGSTTFGLPNLSQANPLGQAQSSGGAITGSAQIGGSGGAATVTLTAAQLPVNAYTDSGHTHNVIGVNDGAGSSFPSDGAGRVPINGGGSGTEPALPYVASSTGFFYGLEAASAAASISNSGGGGSHPNVGPFVTGNFIIRTTVQ